MTLLPEFGKELRATQTPIPGLIILELPVHGDARGWFKENWQRAKMIDPAIGLPDLRPVQNNISFNDAIGTTRGIHAEPWDKYVSVATGRVFAAWVDLREGPSFGAVYTAELDATRAAFVPRGVGNSYQTLSIDTTYTYLVNDHWSAAAEYTFLNLADESAAIPWPIPLTQGSISEKDRRHPRLADVKPMPPKRILVVGANGQVGRALRAELGGLRHVEFASRAELDLGAAIIRDAWKWSEFGTIINAAAYTDVDRAETPDGRRQAWATNVSGVAALAAIATDNNSTLIHVSSDYVFDGTKTGPYVESDGFSPLGVYGQTKAAGDAVVSLVPRHFILRTSWVVGEGDNFVRVMARLAGEGRSPRVVNDQVGRLTFTSTIARAISHLLAVEPPYGTYNLTNDGDPVSWYKVATSVFRHLGQDPGRVVPVSTAEYYAERTGIAPRPRNSVLDIGKLEATGFSAPSWREELGAALER